MTSTSKPLELHSFLHHKNDCTAASFTLSNVQVPTPPEYTTNVGFTLRNEQEHPTVPKETIVQFSLTNLPNVPPDWSLEIYFMTIDTALYTLVNPVTIEERDYSALSLTFQQEEPYLYATLFPTADTMGTTGKLSGSSISLTLPSQVYGGLSAFPKSVSLTWKSEDGIETIHTGALSDSLHPVYGFLNTNRDRKLLLDSGILSRKDAADPGVTCVFYPSRDINAQMESIGRCMSGK